jgi:hypothetical protein
MCREQSSILPKGGREIPGGTQRNSTMQKQRGPHRTSFTILDVWTAAAMDIARRISVQITPPMVEHRNAFHAAAVRHTARQFPEITPLKKSIRRENGGQVRTEFAHQPQQRTFLAFSLLADPTASTAAHGKVREQGDEKQQNPHAQNDANVHGHALHVRPCRPRKPIP